MSRYRRANTAGATYFFTVVTYRRQPILCDAPVREALREASMAVRKARPFTIDAWVLLLNHLHCIWTLLPGDNNFSAIVFPVPGRYSDSFRFVLPYT